VKDVQPGRIAQRRASQSDAVDRCLDAERRSVRHSVSARLRRPLQSVAAPVVADTAALEASCPAAVQSTRRRTSADARRTTTSTTPTMNWRRRAAAAAAERGRQRRVDRRPTRTPGGPRAAARPGTAARPGAAAGPSRTAARPGTAAGRSSVCVAGRRRRRQHGGPKRRSRRPAECDCSRSSTTALSPASPACRDCEMISDSHLHNIQ